MSVSRSLVIGHLNLNCLTNKVNLVQKILISNNIDVLGISETWLTSEIEDSFINIPGYEIVRSDSPGLVKKHGVAIYVNKSIRFEVINSCVKNVVIIYLFKFGIHLVTVYRPPSYSVFENDELLNFLCNFCPDKEIVVQGDFNLPSLHWELDDISMEYVTPLDNLFFETFISAGLQQVVNESTCFPSGNVLDLFLTSNSERIGSCLVMPPFLRCSHSPVLCTYVFQDIGFDADNVEITQRLWTKGRFDIMSDILNVIDWDDELHDLSPDLQYRKFLNILDPMINRYVPLIDLSKKQKLPWNKNPPRNLIQNKSDLWSNFKQLRHSLGRRHPDTLASFDSFRHVNEQIMNFSINSQKNYERLIGDQISFNPKLFHSYVKHRRVGRPGVGPIRDFNGDLSDDPLVMANSFANAFSSVFTTVDPVNANVHQFSDSLSSPVCITSSLVETILNSLDPNSSLGEDGIHPRMLKALALQLSVPLSIIFKNSIQSGILPYEWLSSIVIPLYKKSFRYDPLNYRPVSLTSVSCKVLEKIIVSHLLDYLNENHLLNKFQYGFRPNHSTVDQLLATYNDVTLMLDDCKIVDLIFFDFSKAFDVVSHNILLQKLDSLGIHGHILSWIKGFLSHRTMRVRVAGVLSGPVPVTSGVPQGSVLGPLLFLIYVNYTVANINCYYRIFADDIKIYFASESSAMSLGVQGLQSNVNLLVKSAESWGLRMNIAKCVVMRFCSVKHDVQFSGQSPYKINDNYLNFVQFHSDLGVTIDRSLKFHSHITKVVGCMNGLTSNLLGCTLCRDEKFLINIYTSHVRPKLEYASPLWNVGYLGDLRLLERIQRRWTRAVSGLEDKSYLERLKHLDLFSLKGRLLRTDLILLWKIVHKQCAIESSELFTFRTDSRRGHSYKIFLPRARLDVRRRYFAVRVVHLWNSLSGQTVEAENLNMFKALLKRDLGDILYEFD